MLIDRYREASRTVTEEVDTSLPLTSGHLPDGLRGVLFRNGPGRLERGGVAYGHPFDGDGMITRFEVTDRGVRYRNRFVETEEYVAERRADRMLFRGFGSNLPGGLGANLLRLRFKNAANTSVVAHGGRLLALWEGGLPHAIDPVTLATRGRHDYAGRLRSRAPLIDRMLAPELPFSAHPKLDPVTGELVNFGTLLGRRPQLALYRADTTGRLAEPRFLSLDRLVFLHDFVLTERYLVFFLVPVSFAVGRALLGLCPPAEAIEQQDGAPTRILVVPRDGGEPRWLSTAPCFVFHYAAAHDEGDRIQVDGFRMARFPRLRSADLQTAATLDYPTPVLTRFTLDLGRRTVSERVLTDHPGELPGLSPLPGLGPRRFVWAIGARPGHPEPFFPCLWKLDTESGAVTLRDLGEDLPGEPVFVPRPDAAAEDDGWVLSLVYRSAPGRSELVVLDARTLDDVATFALPHHVPPGFHGTWVPAA